MLMETEHLIDEPLDLAVAMAEGGTDFGSDGITYGFRLKGQIKVIALGWAGDMVWAPSRVGSIALDIMEREHIYVRPTFTEGGYRTPESRDAVMARIELPKGAKVFVPKAVLTDYGPTQRVAAMRVWVLSQLGETVDIPDDALDLWARNAKIAAQRAAA